MLINVQLFERIILCVHNDLNDYESIIKSVMSLIWSNYAFINLFDSSFTKIYNFKDKLSVFI